MILECSNEWHEEVGKEQQTRSKGNIGAAYGNCLINAFVIHADND